MPRWFRLRRREDSPPAPVAPGGPAAAHGAEYESVLVHFAQEVGYDPQVIATASKLAARRRRGIHVLVTIAVPHSLALDEPFPEGEAGAKSIIEQAKVQGGRRVTGHAVRVRPGQAGRRIIDEARELRAAAVVLALPRRIDGMSLFGKTIEAVLAERPCRVIIESPPPDHTTRRRRTAAEIHAR